MRVFDCFLFYNEIDLLRVRLNYLRPYVDQFVLVECTRNHNDKPVNPIFSDYEREFRDYPITHIVLDDLPRGGSNWDRVIAHRNGMLAGIDLDNDVAAQDSDIVLTSDMDEIPSAEALQSVLTSDHWLYRGIRDDGWPPRVGAFLQQLYYYQPTFRCSEQDGYVWEGTRICTAGMLRKYSPQGVRHVQNSPDLIGNTVQVRGGWHFSYFGDAAFIRNKIESIAETHDVVGMADMSVEAIDSRVRANRDLYERENEHWGVYPFEAKNFPPGMERFLWK